MTPTITLSRPGADGYEEFDLDVTWIVERRWPVVTSAWFEGRVFPLSDKETEELEERIYYENEESINGY